MSRAAAPFPLGAETSRTDRLEGGPGFSGTAGTCRATIRDPGALCGRLGAGVVAYVPRYGAYVTLSRAPRETALFQVHCCHSSLFVGSVFRNGSQWFASGATCRPSRIVALCRAAMRRYAPVRGDPPHWLAMARYDTPGVRRFTSPSPAGGVTRPDMARILPGVPVGGNTGPSYNVALWRGCCPSCIVPLSPAGSRPPPNTIHTLTPPLR